MKFRTATYLILNLFYLCRKNDCFIQRHKLTQSLICYAKLYMSWLNGLMFVKTKSSVLWVYHFFPCRFSRNLTWRDMQHIVLRTSNPEPLLANTGWVTNGVGRKGKACCNTEQRLRILHVVCMYWIGTIEVKVAKASLHSHVWQNMNWDNSS